MPDIVQQVQTVHQYVDPVQRSVFVMHLVGIYLFQMFVFIYYVKHKTIYNIILRKFINYDLLPNWPMQETVVTILRPKEFIKECGISSCLTIPSFQNTFTVKEWFWLVTQQQWPMSELNMYYVQLKLHVSSCPNLLFADNTLI